MTKTGKYIALTVGLIIVAMVSKASTTTWSGAARLKRFAASTQAKLLPLYNALINSGINDPQLNFALAQVLFETGNFSSKSSVASKNNNYSGIMFINKPGVQKNATKGLPFPAKEGNYYYANFKTPQDWANDYIRILSLNNKPIVATSLDSFVARLAANKYFYPNTGTALTNYRNGVKKYYDLLTV